MSGIELDCKPPEKQSSVELLELRVALKQFERLSLANFNIDDEVYDKLKAVLAADATEKFQALFRQGNSHIIRELLEMIKPRGYGRF